MENSITAIILLLIALKSNDNQLTYLMVVGCISASVIEETINDISLYYFLIGILLSFLVQFSIKIRSTSAFIYAIIMCIQMAICLVLFTDYSEALNAILEDRAIFITASASVLTITLSITGSDNQITRLFKDENET